MSSIDQAIKLIRPYYERNPSGGNMHVALDDGNLDAGCIIWCMDEAKKEGDDDAITIGSYLLSMSEDERYDLYDRYAEYAGA